ncbi:hypothetical protein SCA6_016458 [Theobroma cacao]
MGQQSLIYSFVARGTMILAEYTEFTGNFTSIAAQCLQKLPASNNKFTYNCDGHTFNYLVENGFTYCVVAVESAGRQVPIAFLERVKEDFNKRYGGGKAATATANSLNREFGSKLKEHMQYCVDHPEEISKLAKVKAQVSEVKGVMMENIEKVLDRGEKIELLVDKTENLRSQAQDFRQQGTKMRRKMWFQNMKIKLIVLGPHPLIIPMDETYPAYCVVAVESAGRQVPIAFLERVKEDFNKRYGGGKLQQLPRIAKIENLEISKLAKVKAQVSEVKGSMMENIEKVLDCGEKIELLVDKTENLRSQAQDFRQQGTKMRRKMCLQNMKIELIVLGAYGCMSSSVSLPSAGKAFIRCMEERFGLSMESGLCQRMDLRSKHLDSMQWRVSMVAVELNYPVDFSKIMEFEGFGRRAKVTNNIKNGLKETVENDLSSNFSLLQVYGYRMSLRAEHLGKLEDSFQEPQSLDGSRKRGKKKEVKETGLGLSFTKDENFKEWYFEVAVNDEMIEYNDIFSYYILRPWAISSGRLSHIIFILIAV